MNLFATPRQLQGRRPENAPSYLNVPVPIDMCITCKYALHMSKMIQLRNVPDALHRCLKSRAAMAGMSLSDYLLAEMKEIAERPTLAEFRERLHSRKPVSASIDTAAMVRQEREAR